MSDPSMHEPTGYHIKALESLTAGENAVDELVRHGQDAVPFLADYLLNGKPKSVGVPRCRAARALGELGAFDTLAAYFQRYHRPEDSVLLFAEDAVRSVAAQELLHWNSPEAFQVLLNAAKQRATAGLVLVLGEFQCSESIPVLFAVLEDDLCREQAKDSLLKTPDATRNYAILTIRGATETDINSPSSTRRKRAMLQILKQIGIHPADWPELRGFLWDEDPDVVIASAQIGFTAAEPLEWESIMTAMLSIAPDCNGFQEEEIAEVCDGHFMAAHALAADVVACRVGSGENPNWASPLWRILRHILGDDLRTICHDNRVLAPVAARL